MTKVMNAPLIRQLKSRPKQRSSVRSMFKGLSEFQAQSKLCLRMKAFTIDFQWTNFIEQVLKEVVSLIHLSLRRDLNFPKIKIV